MPIWAVLSTKQPIFANSATMKLDYPYSVWAWQGESFPKPCGAMDGGAERTGRYSQRVLESSPPVTLTPYLINVRKFRKFPPFHRPVTEDQAF